MGDGAMAPDLRTPLTIGPIRLPNRLYRAPVLEGAASSSDPAKTYARHFVANARAGVGLIVQGNTVVTPEGRTSPGMQGLEGRDQLLALRPMVQAVHDAGAAIVMQLGHGGSFALESWNRAFMAKRSAAPLAPSPLPWWLRPVHTGVSVPSEGEVEALIERFGLAALWAREAGYDGVQLAGANAKLLHQFLSPLYNRRPDRFGGDARGRFTLLAEIRAAIARAAGEDFPVWLKYTAYEHTPLGRGISLDDGVVTAQLAERAGFGAITPVQAHALPNTSICRGDYPADSLRDQKLGRELDEAAGSPFRRWAITAGMFVASKQFPFSPVWNRTVFSTVKKAVGIPVFAVGGIRDRAEADALLREGVADMIGVGRPFYAEPALARRWLGDDVEAQRSPTVCASCNACIVPQMLGRAGVCYNPQADRGAARRARAASRPESPT